MSLRRRPRARFPGRRPPVPESWWGTVGPGFDYLYTLEQARDGRWVPSLIDSRTDAVLVRGGPVEGFSEARERAIVISRGYLEKADPAALGPQATRIRLAPQRAKGEPTAALPGIERAASAARTAIRRTLR